ncbi:glycosyl hydrolase family 18 protein [Jatrophihabitans endophyticus]|uniref:glycosyl hydrolase family 18 protein n=1 Tax=Jatrophihabitans endophyticus TaxID=1206085 RepID=UPI00135670E1|nr:glycosyl hydrolase family 18 protein [Jatrophihabitans endophyticus]
MDVRDMGRRTSRVAVVTVLVGASLVVGADAPALAARRLPVTAFQSAGDPTSLIDRSRAAITTVGVDGVVLRASGASVTAPDRGAERQRRRAHHDQLRAELLVSNYSDAVGDFAEPVAHRLLASAAHRRAVVRALVRDVTRRGWDGISVDLEALAPRDTTGLTAFVRALQRALPRRATLSISISTAASRAGYRRMGYDLRALGRAVDRVMLMAYDQHGPWEDTPGPIGALGWQRKGIAAARHTVPRAKLDLGVAGYGYAWRPHSNDQLSVAQARTRAGSRARFDEASGEWTARLADGSTLWWSDRRSWQLRVKLARTLGLHGLALWVLGRADPLR